MTPIFVYKRKIKKYKLRIKNLEGQLKEYQNTIKELQKTVQYLCDEKKKLEERNTEMVTYSISQILKEHNLKIQAKSVRNAFRVLMSNIFQKP